MYVSDDQRFDEYGKMFTFMSGGFTLACIFIGFFKDFAYFLLK